MPIHYSLRQNKLTEDADLYAAQVHATICSDTEKIVDRMLQQGSTVTKADCMAVLENAVDAIEQMLLEGQRVNFSGLVDLYPLIRGKFESADDAYDPERHELSVGATCGTRVKKTVKTFASVEKQIAPKPAAMIVCYRDLASQGTNDTITPSYIATISGKTLAFDPAKADEGIFFCPDAGGDPVKADNAMVQRNTSKQLVFLNPGTLPPAMEYHLEVRNRPGGVQDLRVGRLDAMLVVP